MEISPNASLKVQLGQDGNPVIYACGTHTDQAALCTALVAGVCMDSKDPAALLISMMTAAADLMNRIEATTDEA